jgi:flagellar biosynthesis GTPase FlhF
MFEGCTAFTAITIPKSITVIPLGAFAWCAGLKTLVLPEGLTEIAGGNSSIGAFFACTALTSVTIPSTITTIGNTAFRACSALTTVAIPDSVTRIDGGNDFYEEKTLLEWAFPECGKLNLATQARLKKIKVVSYQRLEEERQRQAQRQREEERRSQEKREREEREAQLQAEREAQAKREQEEYEAQAKRAEELAVQRKREQEEYEALAKRQQEEREAQVKREREEAEKLAAQVATFRMKLSAWKLALKGKKPNKKQFEEFKVLYREWASFPPEIDEYYLDRNSDMAYAIRELDDKQKAEIGWRR